MYVDAVCKGIDDIPTVDAETRRMMLHKYETGRFGTPLHRTETAGPGILQNRRPKEPQTGNHALEICYMTGKTYTSFRTQQKKERPFRIIKIGLTRDREELYARINQRVEQMITDGLVEEARNVYPHRALNSLNTVGYKRKSSTIWTVNGHCLLPLRKSSRIHASTPVSR